MLDLPILYLSKFIIENKQLYYLRLRRVTETGEWEEWIIYILDAVKNTSIITLNKINQIKELFDKTRHEIQTKFKTIYSKDLVEYLFMQPYCRIEFITRKNIASRNTASKFLGALAEKDILRKIKVRNSVLYLNEALMEILSS